MDGSNTSVIVAIPAQEDYVWRISSQKVPHLTLLNLGPNPVNLDRIASYLEHAASTSLTKFGLEVDRRDVLGPKEADVLIFSRWCDDKIRGFRGNLLANRDVILSYNTTPQFDGWIPHLTLGYPDNPAKPDTRDYPHLSWVQFDRIALWTGDFEGPEFRLKTEFASEDLSMSDKDALEYLKHYGVKGMRWGVRRLNTTLQTHGPAAAKGLGKDPTKTTFKKEATKAGGLHKVSDKDLKRMLSRMDMEKRFSQAMNEDKERRLAGLKAVGKILGEVGKIALPVLLTGFAVKTAATNPVFRTTATVIGKRALETGARALGR